MLFRKKRINTIFLVYGPPLFLAIFARIILFINWLESPFRHYHKLSGLDMKTMLTFGEQFYKGGSKFSIYELFLAIIYFANGESYSSAIIVFSQHCMGIVTALLIAYITLRIFGNRIAAAISGCFAGIYAPSLIYESVILKESVFLFTATVSISVILYSRKHHFSPKMFYISGIAAALPCLVRFSGLLWLVCALIWIFLYVKRKANFVFQNSGSSKKSNFQFIKISLLPLAGALTLLAGASFYNYTHHLSPVPFPSYPSFSYIFKIGAAENLRNLSLPGDADSTLDTNIFLFFLKKIPHYTGNFLSLFNAYEKPNNVNYYFVKEILKPLKYMLGPLLLIPLAITGMAILAFQRKLCSETSLVLFYILSFAVPLIVFVPLSRYRLILTPAFCIFSVYSYVFLREKTFNKKLLPALCVLAVYFISTALTIPGNIHIRAEDYVAYGAALEFQKGDVPEVEICYVTAHLIDPESKSAAIYLAQKLMQHAKFKEAEKILEKLYIRNPGNHIIAMNYACSLLGSRQPEKAGKILLRFGEPANNKSKVNYYYQLAESHRLQNKKEDAIKYYQKALNYSEEEKQKNTIKKALSNMQAIETGVDIYRRNGLNGK